MNTYSEKKSEQKAVTTPHNLSIPGAGKKAINLQDNRPKIVAQLKQQEKGQAVMQPKKNNTGLPDNLKTGIEKLSGYSMHDVKVHYNSAKPAQLQALAYAQGTDIHVAPGQEKHLPHEAWHVVQQKQGRVRPTMQMRGSIDVNDNISLENEATTMGKSAYNTSSKTSTEVQEDSKLYNSGEKESKIKRDTIQKEVVQRIIVIHITEIDFGMIVNVYQMLKNGIDDRVTLLSILSKSDIKGEQIGLQGHGYSSSKKGVKNGAYAGLDVTALANFLKTGGINESNEVIDLLSCGSGEDGSSSYAEDFAKEIKYSSTVIANRGLGVTMDNGYVYSKRKRTTSETKEYEQIKIDCSTEIKNATAIADKAKLELNQKNITELEVKNIFMNYGVEILRVANNLFTKLYEHQRKLLSAHDDADNGLYTSQKK